MGAIIWQKVTTCNTTGGATVMGSFPYPRSGIVKLDYEFILILKKYGNAPKPSKEVKEKSRLTQDEWNRYFVGHWNFPGEKQEKHLAMFPEELPKRLIKMFSFVGDTILDPFLGSGTTSLAAKNLVRNSIGYEMNETFLPIIKEKLGMQQRNMLEETTFKILRQKQATSSYTDEISKLPYIFHDPVAFDKKINPKKLTFGSKIDNSHHERETYYSVKEVISPTRLVLSNGLNVRLLGVMEVAEKNGEAVCFLKDKTRGQKVFMKYDTPKYDNEDYLFCYLYLRNKTFLNAHLIRNGMARADTKMQYAYKTKFLTIQKKATESDTNK
jgi:site-specific DNA-methyltransferase (adenine-specific)